jgi:hypothetical protein
MTGEFPGGDYDLWKTTPPDDLGEPEPDRQRDLECDLERAEHEIAQLKAAGRMGYADLYTAVRGLLPGQTFFIGVGTQHQHHPNYAHAQVITRWHVSYEFKSDRKEADRDRDGQDCQLIEGATADEVYAKLREALPATAAVDVGDIPF